MRAPENQHGRQADPETLAESTALIHPWQLDIPSLLREEARLRLGLANKQVGRSALLHRLASVEAALRKGGQ